MICDCLKCHYCSDKAPGTDLGLFTSPSDIQTTNALASIDQHAHLGISHAALSV